jgi:hypothetical protein
MQMENDRLIGNRLIFSDDNFRLLLTFLNYLDLQRDTTSSSKIINQETLDFYNMLDRFYSDRPAVRLSIAGMALGALTGRDAQAQVTQNLASQALLEDENLHSVSNLGQQLDFIRTSFNDQHPEFIRLLKKRFNELMVDANKPPELVLTSLSSLWSASRSDKFRHELETAIGERFAV